MNLLNRPFTAECEEWLREGEILHIRGQAVRLFLKLVTRLTGGDTNQ